MCGAFCENCALYGKQAVTRPVAFIGPLPPPLHGFSSVCSMMLARLRLHGAVEVFDRAPRAVSRARELLRQLRTLANYFATLRGSAHSAVYLGLSGGLGQAIDALYVLIARALRRPLFVHHHSFAYLTRANLVNRLVFSQLHTATHIVLSERMASALARRYRIDPSAIRVVSNAAFLGPPDYIARPPIAPLPSALAPAYMAPASIAAGPSATATPLVIGFLSNITFDKGFVEFFGVLAQLRRLKVTYRATIAGPVAPDARATFDQLLAAAEQVDYVGPLYDDAKKLFYQQLDILLFPSRYANEAEPLVIHEALRNAVTVIATPRGATPELLSNGAGLVIDADGFVASAASYIDELDKDRSRLARARELAFAQAQRVQLRAEAQLADLLRQIQQVQQ
jgi:glycosyltransferase involved in cell wall biosynthesis